MITPLFQGLFLGASMIIPIGAQNSHVLSHGIKQNSHILAATICMVCDVLLIALGVFGAAKALASFPTLITVIKWGGVLFLLTYASFAFKNAYLNKYADMSLSLTSKSKIAVIITTLAVTLLNPHVYLDTVVILGSVGGQFDGAEKIAFATGTMLASIIWFYSLATGAAKLSPWLSKPKVQRAIDVIIGLIMTAIGVSLALSV